MKGAGKYQAVISCFTSGSNMVTSITTIHNLSHHHNTQPIPYSSTHRQFIGFIQSTNNISEPIKHLIIYYKYDWKKLILNDK